MGKISTVLGEFHMKRKQICPSVYNTNVSSRDCLVVQTFVMRVTNTMMYNERIHLDLGKAVRLLVLNKMTQTTLGFCFIAQQYRLSYLWRLPPSRRTPTWNRSQSENAFFKPTQSTATVWHACCILFWDHALNFTQHKFDGACPSVCYSCHLFTLIVPGQE